MREIDLTMADLQLCSFSQVLADLIFLLFVSTVPFAHAILAKKNNQKQTAKTKAGLKESRWNNIMVFQQRVLQMCNSPLICIIFTLAKQQSMKRKSQTPIIFLLIALILTTHQQLNDYLVKYFYQTLPGNKALVGSEDVVRMLIYVLGSTQHHQICLGVDGAATIDAASLYSDDDKTFSSYTQGEVKHFVYIKTAPGLVKIQMTIFANGIKIAQNFEVAAQYDKGFRFFQLSSTVNCKFVAEFITQMRLVSPDADPFSSSLPVLANGDATDLVGGGVYYIRLSNPSTSTQLKEALSVSLNIQTLIGNECSNPCPFSQQIFGLFPFSTNQCICTSNSEVYRKSLNKCQKCVAQSTQLQCTTATVTCGNGVKQTGEQCDNGNVIGCKSCKKDAGYQCTQNAKKLSTCSNTPTIQCGNGIKETGQECDNRKQPGCTDCTIAAGYACVEDANKLSTCSIPFQVPFQKLNHKLGVMTTHFYAEAGQKLLVTSYNGGSLGNLRLNLFDPDSLGLAVTYEGQILEPVTLEKTGTYKATLYDATDPMLLLAKIVFKLDGVIFKEYYQIMPFTFFSPKRQILYQFTSTKTCKVKAYFTGTGVSSVTEFKIIKPGTQLFDDRGMAYLGNYDLKFTPSQLPFAFDIDVIGKWHIQVYEAGDGSKDLNLDLKTFSVNGCQNPCTQYLSANVIGLVPQTTDTCLCDDSSIRLLWDSSKKRCVAPAFPPKQVPFFKAKYYIGAPRVMFPIKKDQKLKVEFTKNGGNAATMKNLVTTGNYETKFQSTSTVYQEVCQFQNVYSAISQEQSEETINAVKISVQLDDKLVKQHYQSLGKQVTISSTKYHRVLYEVSTTKACKVKAYFSISALYGTAVLNGFNFRVYQPGNPVYPTSADELTSFSTYRFTDTDLPYTFDLTAAGKWYVQYLISNDNAAQFLTLDLKTLDTDACENPCSQYLSQTSVLGLAPGTTDTCLCDDTSAPTLWNSVSKKCEEVLFIVCGNGVKEDGEECDNKKQTGCTDCKVAAGYFCSEDQAKLSTCVQNRCGDSKKGGSEECDNGNTTGCINCKVSSGYECSGGLGQKSTCTEKCGDGIRLAGEDCDNGGSAGCTNCKIDPGYNCVHNLYSKSLCLPICGDGIRAVTEECDNKNQTGCINCKPVPGFKCSGAVGAISDCKITCGDSVFGGSQQCDNGNQAGCSANCVPDKGYVCKNEVGARSVCSTVCGDGIRAGTEVCDNGKKIGCLTCNQEDDGFDCTGAVGQRSTCKSICGDSKRQANEQCDNGNAAGCSKNCLPDIGYTCTGSIGAKSTCQTQCGDSIKAGTEACDNGKRKGCSNCIVQSGYTCKLAANMKTSVCSKA